MIIRMIPTVAISMPETVALIGEREDRPDGDQEE